MSNIARDCGIDRTTVQGFYQILEDTLLGYFIYPYRKKLNGMSLWQHQDFIYSM